MGGSSRRSRHPHNAGWLGSFRAQQRPLYSRSNWHRIQTDKRLRREDFIPCVRTPQKLGICPARGYIRLALPWIVRKNGFPDRIQAFRLPEGSVTRQTGCLRSPFKYLAEVKAVDCMGNCHREKPGTAKQRPEKKLPIVDSLLTDYSQIDNGFGKCYKVTCADPRLPAMRRLVGFQEF